MKSIHAVFTDREHKKIAEKKKKSGLGWHDFLLLELTKGLK